MVLNLGMPYRTEEYRVETSQLLHTVRRHHLAMFEVVLRAPRKLDEVPLDAMLATERVQDFQRLVNHVDTDAVSLDHRNAVFTQLETSHMLQRRPFHVQQFLPLAGECRRQRGLETFSYKILNPTAPR